MSTHSSKREKYAYKVVFYDDSPVFGGHEKMALAAHQAIARYGLAIEITWIVNQNNRRLTGALEAGSLAHIAMDLEPTFRWVRNPLAVIAKVLRVAQVMRKLRPHLAVLIQGDIANSFDGVFAARRSGVPVCSYIPMAHLPVELGLKRLPRLRSALLSRFYRFIPRYITIDEQQAARVRRVNKHAQVTVVENYIDAAVDTRPTAEAKQRLGLSVDTTVLGVIGRISFWQKSQDWLVQALQNDPFLKNKTLVFVGDGPDSPQLERLIQSSSWRDHMHVLGWNDSMEEIYGALDLLIIPSRAEGVPLVMVEALTRRIPVVGTDRDGMKSWLPAAWRFPFGDATAMKQAIDNALDKSHEGGWLAIEKHLARATDGKRFAWEFGNALIGCCTKAQQLPR